MQNSTSVSLSMKSLIKPKAGTCTKTPDCTPVTDFSTTGGFDNFRRRGPGEDPYNYPLTIPGDHEEFNKTDSLDAYRNTKFTLHSMNEGFRQTNGREQNEYVGEYYRLGTCSSDGRTGGGENFKSALCISEADCHGDTTRWPFHGQTVRRPIPFGRRELSHSAVPCSRFEIRVAGGKGERRRTAF